MPACRPPPLGSLNSSRSSLLTLSVNARSVPHCSSTPYLPARSGPNGPGPERSALLRPPRHSLPASRIACAQEGDPPLPLANPLLAPPTAPAPAPPVPRSHMAPSKRGSCRRWPMPLVHAAHAADAAGSTSLLVHADTCSLVWHSIVLDPLHALLTCFLLHGHVHVLLF